MRTKFNLSQILCLLGLAIILTASRPAWAADSVQDRIANLLASLQASGEYVIGAYHLGDGSDGQLKIIVETTEGKKVFDESGQLTEMVDNQGNRTIYQDGIPMKTVTPSGAIISQTAVQRDGKSGSAWHSSRDYLGNEEKKRVNADGDMVERIDQTGTHFQYITHKDNQGKTRGITEINLRDGTRTMRFFDSKTGDINRLIDNQGALITIQYEKDDKGRKLRSFEFNTRNGKTTEKMFDARGREIQINESGGLKKSIEYELDGQDHVVASTETVIDQDEQYQVRKTFDVANRVTSEQDSRGRTIEYTYQLAEDGSTTSIEEDETIINEQGVRVRNHRVRILGKDGRVESLVENGIRTDYEYEVDEFGRILATTETKRIAATGQKLHTQRTEMDEQGLPRRAEKWEESGPLGKRHSVTAFINDPLSGKTRQTAVVNDLGDLTVTKLDEAGRPERSETWETYGARLKRHSVTKITTDRRTGLTASTDSVNDQGDRTVTTMDERGLAIRSETWNARGATLKRHSVTQIQTNPLTGKPERTVSINDRGDITITYMNEDGLPFLTDSQDSVGATLGRNKSTAIQTDPVTGQTRSTRTQSGLATAVTLTDENGLAISSESQDVYGATLKRHKEAEIVTDPDTGLTRQTESRNDRDDRVLSIMDDDGLAVSSEAWNSLGANLKRHSLSTINTDPDTEMTTGTKTVNDLGDYSETVMDEEGLPVVSYGQNVLGAVLKRTSVSRISTSPETGLPVSSDTRNLIGDRTLTLMDENGLAERSEGWLARGAILKRHSRTEIQTDPDTGETASTNSLNDRGDKTATIMDENGLPQRSEGNLALGATLKRHSFTTLTVDPDTGMTRETQSQNDRGDETLSTMDENGLAVSSKSQQALGAILKKTSTTVIQTDPETGETVLTHNRNERGDENWTAMDENGLAFKSRAQAALGANLKKNSMTAIQTDPETGETEATHSLNDRQDHTTTAMDENGLAVGSAGYQALGAMLKRSSATEIKTDQDTGETAETLSVNDRGDKTWSGMNQDGLTTASEAWLKVGANLKRHSLTEITTDRYTGETAATRSVNDRGDRTITVMDDNGLATNSESWQALGASLKQHSLTEIETDRDTGETRATASVNDRGDQTWTVMDENGLATRSESDLALGAILKQHSTTVITTNFNTGETMETLSINDREDVTWTQMDENGLAVTSRSDLALGALAKRPSITAITTDEDTGETRETDSVNDRGDRTWTVMNEHGLATNSESWLALGATLKQHSVTGIDTNPETGETAATSSLNDRGDQTLTAMDRNGLAVSSESTLALGANLKKHSLTDITTDAYTGETASTLSVNDREDLTLTTMDENGLAEASASQLALGALLKQGSTTKITTDQVTGETADTYSLNERGDQTWTVMDENGLATGSRALVALGANLKKNSVTAIQTDPETGETEATHSLNDRQDHTTTVMDENGLAVGSAGHLSLGALLKQRSRTEITTNQDTGETAETLSVNDRGDKTWSGMNENGLAMASESWLAVGANLKLHSVTEITTDRYTGETAATRSVNDRGDRTITVMDDNGLATNSESWQALGASLKQHSLTEIETDRDTGETRATASVNDRGDQTWTVMDENGLATRSESDLALGAILKQHSTTVITTNFNTGETMETLSINDREDVTWTQMDENGLAVKSRSDLALGALAKRPSITAIRTDEDTGETRETDSLNERGDRTWTIMNEHGLATNSESWLALGATLKQHSLTDITTDPDTGETRETDSVNDRGDRVWTVMNEHGLATDSESTLALGANLKKHSLTDITTDAYTGETASTLSVNDREDLTLTTMDENGLAEASASQLALGAILKQGSTTTINTDQVTGETADTYSLNERGDQTWTVMDENGLATGSRALAALGANLKKNSVTAIQTDPETGETEATHSLNDRQDHTTTVMDENGLAVGSAGHLSLGALLKQGSRTEIKTNQDTGETAETLSVNDRGDKTWSGMNKNGLAMASESWLAVGANLKLHSVTEIRTDRYTGETAATRSVNDRGDRTLTVMDENGLATNSESWQALGATLKQHSLTSIETDPDTGETRATASVNDRTDRTWTIMNEHGLATKSQSELALGATLKLRSITDIRTSAQTGETLETLSVNERGDRVRTVMDENGLATNSESWLALGATLKQHSTSTIETNAATGETRLTDTINDRGDRTTTHMNAHGLAESSESTLALGATLKQHSLTEIDTDPQTGETASTASLNDRGDLVVTTMDENGLAVSSDSQMALGAELKQHTVTDITTDPFTGETASTHSLNDREDHTWTVMDENGLATGSRSEMALGAILKRSSWSTLQTNQDTGETEASFSVNGLGDLVETRMNEHGLPATSEAWLTLGARLKQHTRTQLETDPDTGETAGSTSVNDLGDRTVTEMDQNGLAVASESWTTLGARLKQHSVAEITSNQQTGEIDSMYSVNDLGEESWTWMNAEGLAESSLSLEELGALDGRRKRSIIQTDPNTGVTASVFTWDGLHEGPLHTIMDQHGLAVESKGRDRYGPYAGRTKRTTMVPNRDTGMTLETFTFSGLQDGAVHTVMDQNGFAVESESTNQYGPPQGRFQEVNMTPDTDTGMTLSTHSLTRTGPNGLVITETSTQNHPVLGTPESSVSLNTFGAFKGKATAFTADPNTGLTLRSVVTDEGGESVNEHSKFGITSSTRTNVLGAIKRVVTTNTLNDNTGLVRRSNSEDRKGVTASQYDGNGLSTVSIRTNTGATYIPTETTRAQTWNPYTGSPLFSVSTDAHGSTNKHFDLDGFMERSVRRDEWGEVTTTTYTNNRETGMPLHSLSNGPTGNTETWYEDNGLALRSSFRARIGLHSETTNYYNALLDMVSTKSVDERGNISVNVMNTAGEVTHTYSKNGTTTMDLTHNRASSSSGPGGGTTYHYSGRYLARTTGENTSWYDQRQNGAANRVQTEEGTTSYNNRYNSRGFVTYRTESNGKDSGYSRFNSYGDQEYTEWKGKVPSEPADQYGNQFLGGTWKSETTYRNNSRGDVQSWTTKSSWTGTVKYVEIGHYEFECTEGYDPETGACIGGNETYVVDQAAHNETVGDTTTKTETPDHSPESDSWILSHLKGSQPTGVVLAAGTPQPDRVQAASAIPGERDATQTGYHEVYQKNLATALAKQGYAEKLKGKFQHVVERIRGLLEHFALTGEIMSLQRIASYQYQDMNAFRRDFQKADKKAEFLWKKTDDIYYHFSGEHLTTEQFKRTDVVRGMYLVERPATIASLQDWLLFAASTRDQKAIGKKLSQAAKALDQEESERGQQKQIKAISLDLAQTLAELSRENLDITLSAGDTADWLKATLDSPEHIAQLAKVLDQTAAQSSSGRVAQGVLLGGGLGAASAASGKGRGAMIDPERLGGIKSVAVSAATAGGGAQSGPAERALTQAEKARAAQAGKPRSQEDRTYRERGFEDIVHVHRLRLRNEQKEPGKKTQNSKGEILQIEREDGARKTFVFAPGSRTEVKSFTAAGQLDSTAEYRAGWLQQVSFAGGAEINMTYTMKRGKTPKSVNVHVKKDDEERIYKYDGQGKLQSVLAKDGGRMTVIEQPEEEEPLSELLDALQDSGTGKPGNRFESEKIKEQPRLQE